MRQLLTGIAALLVAAGCTAFGKGNAMPLCTYEPIETDAWINRMPGPGGPSGNLVVMIQVRDDGISRRFDTQGVDETGTLRLDIVEWGEPAGLGKIVYRNQGLNPKRIEIWCGGQLRDTIESVMSVY